MICMDCVGKQFGINVLYVCILMKQLDGFDDDNIGV